MCERMSWTQAEGKYQRISLEQNTPDWLAFRRGKIGASDAPIIMGVSPWKTPYGLWNDKVFPEHSKQKYTIAMQKGHEIEEKVINWFFLQYGFSVYPCVLQSIENPWMIASMDGFSGDGTIQLEIKYANESDHFDVKRQMVPDKYKPQLQHQMSVSGNDFCYYASCYRDDIQVIMYHRDQEYIDKIIEKEKEFLEFIKLGVPPPLESRDYKEMDSEEWKIFSDELKAVRVQQNVLKSKEDNAKDELIRLANGNNCKGNGVYVKKIYRKGNIPYSSIQKVTDMDLEEFRTPDSEYWKVF